MIVKELLGKPKKCVGCGQEFIPTTGRPDLIKFCSPQCKNKYNNTKYSYKYVCANCGKEFTRKFRARSNRVFCCNKCVGEYSSKQSQDKRICEFCNKTFITIHSDPKRFCSIKCQNDWQRANPRVGENHPSYNHDFSKEQRTLKCQYCGKEYEVSPHLIDTSKFCSRQCKHAGMIQAARLQKTWAQRTNSLPQQKINKLLEDMGIKYQNEYDCGLFFTVDNYCVDSGLMIEVMGTYWHADIRKNTLINEIQKRDIIQDKRKKTYIFHKFGINILYLWEEDINKNLELCKQLIELYLDNNGKLEDYNSFNYVIENNQITLSQNKLVGYMDRKNDYDKLLSNNKALND